MNLYQVIKRPLITEKTSLLKEKLGQYGFEVDLQANKIQIREAVEKLFKVNVLDVHTARMRGKYHRVGRNVGKRSNWKKAYVTIKQGEKIDLFDR